MTVVDDGVFGRLFDFVGGFEPGDVVGDCYEIRERIGEGGMGTVYACVDRESGGSVALKIVRSYGDHDEKRFEREVTTLERMSHPAIVRYLAHGVHQGKRYVVMDRLVGRTLAERIQRGPLGLSEVVEVGIRIASALDALHEARIVHRDVKPSNVILPNDRANEAKLVDFGVVRPRDATALTVRGARVGTPGYMAPEQVRGDDVDTAADIFALGCVLWECVRGRTLFDGEDEAALFARILVERAPSLDAPKALSSLVERMLEKEPARRPKAAAVARELREIGNDVSSGPRFLAPGIASGMVLSGKYRLDGVLGAGGMGIVLAAQHLELGTRVAIKLLRSGDVEGNARFLREGRAAARLESRHVARVLDVGRTSEGTPYLVIEHLVGIDLAAKLARDGSLSIPIATRYLLQTCEAIAEAHALGIIHRDLKPSNLFVVDRRDQTEEIKVLDFGISKLTEAFDDASRPLTLTDGRQVVGSLPYMSPEQLQTPARVDFRTDIWSLGIVLFELVTNTRPFDGEGAAALAARIAAAEPRALRVVLPDAPAALEQAIAKCLAKDPSQRHTDLVAFARALAPFAPPDARTSLPRIERLLGGSASVAISRPSKWRAATVLTAAAALLGSAFFAFRHPAAEPPTPTAAPSAPPPQAPALAPAPAPAPAPEREPSPSSTPTPTATPTMTAKKPNAPPSAPNAASSSPAKRDIDLRDPALERR